VPAPQQTAAALGVTALAAACADQARSRGDLVAVASFGRFEVISAYLQRICPGVFARSTISTPSCVGTPDGCSVPGGKTPQLDALLATLLPDAVGEADGRSRVLFLDDSVPNVTVRRGWWHLQPAGTTLSGQAL
jgi:hypothetical protein